jgi:hypothetical protein
LTLAPYRDSGRCHVHAPDIVYERLHTRGWHTKRWEGHL